VNLYDKIITLKVPYNLNYVESAVKLLAVNQPSFLELLWFSLGP